MTTSTCPAERMVHRSEIHHLHRLRLAADEEVHAVLASLPGPVRNLAKRVPVTYEARPSADLVKDGLDPDLLGLFVGSAYPEQATEGDVIPSQIILFLECLWDYAAKDAETFREEVRRTYLHELGHFLGLDEDDLLERDLD